MLTVSDDALRRSRASLRRQWVTIGGIALAVLIAIAAVKYGAHYQRMQRLEAATDAVHARFERYENLAKPVDNATDLIMTDVHDLVAHMDSFSTPGDASVMIQNLADIRDASRQSVIRWQRLRTMFVPPDREQNRAAIDDVIAAIETYDDEVTSFRGSLQLAISNPLIMYGQDGAAIGRRAATSYFAWKHVSERVTDHLAHYETVLSDREMALRHALNVEKNRSPIAILFS